MMESSERVSELLQEINDNQKQLLEQNGQLLLLQREHNRLLQQMNQQQPDSTDAGQRMVRRTRIMMDRSRQLYLVIIFLLALLLIFVSWALFV